MTVRFERFVFVLGTFGYIRRLFVMWLETVSDEPNRMLRFQTVTGLVGMLIEFV